MAGSCGSRFSPLSSPTRSRCWLRASAPSTRISAPTSRAGFRGSRHGAGTLVPEVFLPEIGCAAASLSKRESQPDMTIALLRAHPRIDASPALLIAHEENRLPLLRPLDPVAALADALGVGRAAAVDRPCGRGRGA